MKPKHHHWIWTWLTRIEAVGIICLLVFIGIAMLQKTMGQ